MSATGSLSLELACEIGHELPQILRQSLGCPVDRSLVEFVEGVDERVTEGGGILEPLRYRVGDPACVSQARERVVVAPRGLQPEVDAGENRQVENQLNGEKQMKRDHVRPVGAALEYTRVGRQCLLDPREMGLENSGSFSQQVTIEGLHFGAEAPAGESIRS